MWSNSSERVDVQVLAADLDSGAWTSTVFIQMIRVAKAVLVDPAWPEARPKLLQKTCHVAGALARASASGMRSGLSGNLSAHAVVEVLELLSLAREFYQDSSDMRQIFESSRWDVLAAGTRLPLQSWSPQLAAHVLQLLALARSDEDQLAAEPEEEAKLVVRLTETLTLGDVQGWNWKEVAAAAHVLIALRRRQAHARDTVALERRVLARTRVLLRIDEDDEAGEMACSAENLAIISSALTPYKGGPMLGSSEIVGALGEKLVASTQACDTREMAAASGRVMKALAACSLLSPDATGQLRRKYTRWILRGFHGKPSAFSADSAAAILHALSTSLAGDGGVGSREEEQRLCRDLVGILSREQHWARLPLSASGKFLRAQARLFPGNSCGQEVDALVRKVARVTVEKLRHEDESVCDFWAAGNIVAGLAPSLIDVSGSQADARTPLALADDVALFNELIDAVAGIVLRQSAGELASHGARQLRHLAAAFSLALGGPNGAGAEGQGALWAASVAAACGRVCSAVVVAIEAAGEDALRRSADTEGKENAQGMESALTLMYASRVLTSVEADGEACGELCDVIAQLGEGTVAAVHTMLEEDHVSLSHVAAVLDVLVSASLTLQPWLGRQADCGLLHGSDGSSQWVVDVFKGFLRVEMTVFADSASEPQVDLLAGVAQMMSTLITAYNAGLLSADTAARAQLRLTTLLLQHLQSHSVTASAPNRPSADLPSSLRLRSPSGNETLLFDAGEGAQAGGKPRGVLLGGKGSGVSVDYTAQSMLDRQSSQPAGGQARMLLDLASILQSLERVEEFEADGPDQGLSDSAVVRDAVTTRAAKLVSARNLQMQKGGGSGDCERELRAVVKLLRLAGPGSRVGGVGVRKRDRQFARELVTYLEKCPAMSASGVMVAEMLEGALRSEAVTAALLNTATRLVEAMPLSAWGSGTQGGATVSRVLACLIRIQARLLNKFPRSGRRLLILNDVHACALQSAVAEVFLPLSLAPSLQVSPTLPSPTHPFMCRALCLPFSLRVIFGTSASILRWSRRQDT